MNYEHAIEKQIETNRNNTDNRSNRRHLYEFRWYYL